MPKVLEDRVKALKKQGKSSNSAWAIATATLQREGKLTKGKKSLVKSTKKDYNRQRHG